MYYTVKTDSGTFQILKETKGDIQYFRIIDRSGKDCMQIRHLMMEDPPELVLSGVSYKPNCTMNMDMESGKPTRDMIRALLIFAMKSVESVPDIAFLDQSSFDCRAMDNRHSFAVNLCLYSFILHGKTWYQRYFGAIPFYLEDEAKMTESNNLLDQSYTNVTFEQFVKDALRFVSNEEWLNTLRHGIEIPFRENQTRSWRMFFASIFDRSSPIACNAYEELRPFIQHKFIIFPFNELHMRITRSTIEDFDEYTRLTFIEDTQHQHKKKVANTSNAFLFLNGINYNEMSDINLNSILNTEEYPMNGGRRHGVRRTRRRNPFVTAKYPTYQMYMSESKGRPAKNTRKRK